MAITTEAASYHVGKIRLIFDYEETHGPQRYAGKRNRRINHDLARYAASMTGRWTHYGNGNLLPMM